MDLHGLFLFLISTINVNMEKFLSDNVQQHMIGLLQHREVVPIVAWTHGLQLDVVKDPAQAQCLSRAQEHHVECAYMAKEVQFSRMKRGLPNQQIGF